MAIVGYEVDQVIKGATAAEDVSVPINVAYNHHHDAFFTGKGSRMEKVPYDPQDMSIPIMTRADPNFVEIPVEHTKSPIGLPTSIHISAGNGGEYRKSYHGFAPPVAYVIDSPQSMHVLPMQIDTWNRDEMPQSSWNNSKFVPGPLPRNSYAPRNNPAYSGLLECPITTRVRKIIEGGAGFNTTYAPQLFRCNSTISGCNHIIDSAEECFSAAKNLEGVRGFAVQTAQGPSESMPTGCSVIVDSGALKVFFNTKKSKVCCGADVPALEGSIKSLVNVMMTVSNSSVKLTLSGPDDLWFAVGFFAQDMADQPYTVVVDGKGGVSERQLGNHAAGSVLAPSIKVVSNIVASGQRTIVLTRPAKGATSLHTSFSMQQLEIPFITAIGMSGEFGYHKNKTASTLSLWPSMQEPACVCRQPASPFGSAQGVIKYLPTGEQFGFINYCEPEPRESVLVQRNPSCDVRAYTGGLQTCKHMWSLLDADQEIPWQNQPLVYYQKYRWYFQEYKQGHHIVSMPRQCWGIAAAGGHAEYDVPKAPKGTPVEQAKYHIWGVVTPTGTWMGSSDLHLAAIHFHCHAAACLAMEVWNNQTGELLCRQEPVYGGTGQIDLSKYDEAGYILQPPCLWGNHTGLEPMPRVSGVPLLIKAITNSSYGHHGEMAFPEVTLVPWSGPGAGPRAIPNR
jgi:hypothetical protein